MRISLTPNTTQPKYMSDNEIKRDIKAQENNFMALYKRADKSKTKTRIVNIKGTHVKIEIYYDKKGKELYTTNQIIDKDALHYTHYSMQGANGGQVTFVDHDNDGNMDEMSYVDAKGMPQYQAYDKNDDGVFDSAMHNTGKQIGKTFNLKF